MRLRAARRQLLLRGFWDDGRGKERERESEEVKDVAWD